MSATDRQRIAVIGGGIGGLTLAIALRRHGLDADIYEQTAELREVGAAVALSANATRFFLQFGLEPQFATRWFEVSALIYRDGRSGRLIGEHPAGPAYRQRFGAPYVGIHRAELQAILSAAVGLDRIQLRKRLVGIDDTGTRAALRFDDDSTTEADLVVGADGARSFVRRWMLGYDDALYSGCSGFRGVVPIDALPSLPDPTAIQFWMGPGGHLLHYPMGNDQINFLLVERHPTPWPRRDWVMPATEGEQLRHFVHWHPAVVEMITARPVSDRWGLFHRPPLGRWSKGRVTLLGDAAHALAPHHGQGANQSIEDAVVLAACLADAGSRPIAEALERYEKLRRGRTRKIQYASISTADVLHLARRRPRRPPRRATRLARGRTASPGLDPRVRRQYPGAQPAAGWHLVVILARRTLRPPSRVGSASPVAASSARALRGRENLTQLAAIQSVKFSSEAEPQTTQPCRLRLPRWQCLLAALRAAEKT